MITAPSKEGRKVAGRKKENYTRGRVEFQADPEWIERVDRQARRLGMNISVYVRWATTKQLDHDEMEEAERKPRGK
jgi:hypothetical protein